MKRDLICIICPKGCSLQAEISGDTVTTTGNGCPRGAQYAENECLHPMRTVTATVRVANRPDTMVSVKTENPVPKEAMQKVMEALRQTQAEAPLEIGDVILPNLCGTNILATKAIS